jgi:formate hydrogenlyase subunit 3/multisubunit Na+/H+ antiporter MnhD subunit
MRDVTLDLGLGFGIQDNTDTFGVQPATNTVPIPIVQTNETTMSNTTGGILGTVTGSILGTDEHGNTNTIDLGKYVKLPDVVVKADNSQWWWLIFITIGGLIFYHFGTKNGK